MPLRGHNWIDGARVESASGAWFELLGADGGALGRWPRSSADDLDLALDAARRAAPGWRAIGAGARDDRLRAAAARLLDAPDPDGLAAATVGFARAELARHLRGLDAALEDGLAPACVLARGPLGAREGPCFLAPTWSAAWHAPARAVFFALRAGRPVILAPDGRWPAPADALRAVLEDLPEGVFSVLHDDGRTLARAAVLARDLPTAVAGDDRVDADHEDAPHLVIARARRASVVVDPARDLATQAERIVDAATGRARALSGSRAGQVGRVIAPERVFARAGELVLAALEKSADAARPLPVAYAAQERVLEGALALGLDEGATAVLSGRDTGEPLFPLLFTNVEPAMRIARQDTPCGMLLLVRAHDLRAAHAIAARLDREVRS